MSIISSQPGQGLPALDSAYALSAGQCADFRRNGHILLPAILSAEELATHRPHIVQAVEKFKKEVRPLAERDTYGKAFLQIINLWERDLAVRAFSLARRFGQLAAELLGVDAVRIYHDQALFKEPGGGPTPWHQDQYYWPLDTANTITMWMPLVAVEPRMGPMNFASGSHVEGFLGHLKISDESDAFYDRFVQERGFPLVNYGHLAPGDASFHYGWTLHSAPGNQSELMREVMTIIFFADGAKVIPPDNPNRENDLKNFLPGVVPGQPAVSPLTPVVYDKFWE